MTASGIFKRSVEAIAAGVLITRTNAGDKEFHFQNWFGARLHEAEDAFEVGGRNSYPDFRMVASPEGFELKGLAYPGRDASFDANSQMPTGFHNGRTIYYVFGRYPKTPDGNSYPVLDFVVCHGDFLNAGRGYVHKNKAVRFFGSYGDILIRDRKMYVVPTPFRLIEGAAHHQTLILPAEDDPGADFFEVGELVRTECPEIIVGYSFDLTTNTLTPRSAPNPNAGVAHAFRAWRIAGGSTDPVALANFNPAEIGLEVPDDED